GGFPLAISGLPDNLTFIDLDSNYRHLNNQKFSEGLTILILRCVNDYFCNGYDESNGYDEFKGFNPGTFPQSLKILILEGSADYSLEQNVLPCGLRTLEFNDGFDGNLKVCGLPSNLT